MTNSNEETQLPLIVIKGDMTKMPGAKFEEILKLILQINRLGFNTKIKNFYVDYSDIEK